MEQARKFILYIALGIICLLLWQAWMKDQAQQVPQPKKTVAKPAVTDQTTPQPKPSAQPSAESKPQLSTQVSPPHQWITVKTDTLNVKIDPVGGKLVQIELLKYFQTLQKKQPVKILSPQSLQYYIADGGIIPEKTQKQEPLQYHPINGQSYALKPQQKSLQVTLEAKTPQGLVVRKTYLFSRDQYTIRVRYQLMNQGGQPWSGYVYNQIARRKTQNSGGYFRFHTYTGAAYSTPDTPYNKINYKTIQNQGLDKNVQGGWVSFQQPYFITAWIPQQNLTHRYFAYKGSDDIYTIGLTTPSIDLKPGQTKTFESTFYVGPEIASYLKPLAKGLDLTVDYGWLWFISAAIFWIMKHIYQVVGNWGWSIVLVTVLIKLLFFKLSESSYRSMARMRELQPKLEALKERYGDDRQKLGQATMELYKKEKVNPLGGCLPILVQIPVFIGLYYVLIESVQLRHAPFMLWIQDLSSRDPYYVLPILMGLSMFAQQKLSPQPPDPRQARMMMFLPVIFTLFFMTFPAGLVLYWLVNNCLSVGQQWFIMRRMDRKKSKRSRR